jgi:4-hydroxythreonine-4-phosphate dehydrogenase
VSIEQTHQTNQPPIPPLALTMGEPSGIGPDITLMAWVVRGKRSVPPFAVHADPGLLKHRAADLGLQVPMHVTDNLADARLVFKDRLPVIPLALRAQCIPGKPDPVNAGAVLSSIEHAVTQVHRGQAAAVVTNPIAKSVLYQAGFKHPGHTEYLAALAELHDPSAQNTPVMMLACPQLRVVPVTIHIPLADVPRTLTTALIEKTIQITAAALQRSFGIRHPRLAVTGLNPHAGESGSMGSEENDIIIPALRNLREAGIDVTGPHPADTMFHDTARQSYDAAIAMYHDQALIPVKTLAFDTGVNVTLGLPFVRTSPDHGTAFDIAATGKASPESLIESLKLAAQMAARHAAANIA